MSRKTLVDLLLENREDLKKYFENPLKYARKIKEIVKKHDANAKVLLFGSFVEGKLKPESDIDILIITDLASNVDGRVKLRMEVAYEIGDFTPFEIHIVTSKEYEKWYRKFIGKHIEI